MKRGATFEADHAGASMARPTVGGIFVSFVKIGALLIGGGYAMLPLLEDEMVRRRKWAQQDLNLRPRDYESPALTD